MCTVREQYKACVMSVQYDLPPSTPLPSRTQGSSTLALRRANSPMTRLRLAGQGPESSLTITQLLTAQSRSARLSEQRSYVTRYGPPFPTPFPIRAPLQPRRQ